MKDMRNTNWGSRIGWLGYSLVSHATDNMGRTHHYRTSPSAGSGPINYFDSLSQLVRWVRQVEEIRMMQDNPERHALAVEVGAFRGL